MATDLVSGWSPLPTGPFTGIDWSQPGATDGCDPQLVWAEAQAFASYGGQPSWLPIAIELNAGCTVAQLIAAGNAAWLRVPTAYRDAAPAGLRFCTARVRRGFFDALAPGQPLKPLVKRYEMGLPLAVPGTEGEGAPADPTAMQAAEPARIASEGRVMGIIDDSLAVAQASFLQHQKGPDGPGPVGRTRIAGFWRQDPHGTGGQPAGFDYGHELTADSIACAMDQHTYGGLVDEGAVYVALGLSMLGQRWPHGKVPFHALDGNVSHGTHVTDLAAGAPGDDASSRCPILAVQLPTATVRDSSGSSLAPRILDALMYILARCAPGDHVVVNISFGALAGPHDGTALLECAMEQLIALYAGKLQIVLAAGNSYQLRTHANTQLQPGAAAMWHWHVPPDDDSPSFVQLWIEEGAQGVSLTLTPPGRAALPALALGQSGVWTDTNGGTGAPLAAVIYPPYCARGERGTCILVALAPTFAFDTTTRTAPSGDWALRLANQGGASVVIDGYVERDDVIGAQHRQARQSHFEDDPFLAWDQQYDMAAQVDDPLRATPIRRSGNFNNIATGDKSVAVGGQRETDSTWARYSPRTPDPDAARPQRPGVVRTPDAAAWSDVSPAMAGVPAAGPRSGATVRLAGTSSAAPQIARRQLDAG